MAWPKILVGWVLLSTASIAVAVQLRPSPLIDPPSDSADEALYEMNLTYGDEEEHRYRDSRLRGPPGTGRILGPMSCGGCAVTIDMRCRHTPHWRHAFFHRIVDCMLPLYSLISRVQDVDGQRCAITYFERVDLEIFFSTIWEPLQLKLIDERAACVKDMKYYTTRQHQKRLQGTLDEGQVLDEVPDNERLNVQALHFHVAQYLGGDNGHHRRFLGSGRPLVLVLRTDTRTLTAISERRLREAIGEQVTVYSGKESFTETLDVWANARGIVGYHGAGFANAMFTTQEACVSEISAWMDKDATVPWRTNDRVGYINNLLKWYTYRLPLLQMLEVNRADTSVDNVSDYEIKDWSRVYLTQHDAFEVAEHVLHC